MLQKSQSKTFAKFKYFVLVPLIMLMLTYTSASSQESNFEINISNYSNTDKQLIKNYRLELQKMKENNAENYEIADTFMTELDRHILSKEAYYKLKVYLEYTFKEMNKNDEPYEGLDRFRNQNYEDYVTYRKTQPIVKVTEVQESQELANIPFAVIDQVPLFPGCESLSSNEEQKKCMTNKITEFVSENFNTKIGEDLKLTGVNRVIVQFKIDKTGNIVDVKSRAAHPKLEEEGKRVINSLPQMTPGEQNGTAVGVMYSLPIVFEVNE